MLLGDMRVPEMISQRAAEGACESAVVSGPESLTYQDLERGANRLAHHLQSLGVQSETLVAICVLRSPAAIIASLAVLKAGGAYLPLEASDPAERQLSILTDARPALVITDSKGTLGLLPSSWRILDLKAASAEIANRSSEPPTLQKRIAAEHLAYIIYTSGSTGEPKGVQVTHGNLSNLVAWHLAAFSITPKDRMTQLASLGFDAAVWEIWPCLAAGGCLQLVPDMTRRSAEMLQQFLLAQHVTVSFAPTVLAECMMRLAWPPNTALRLLLTGADTLHQYPPDNLPFKLINNYGPTETTVVATSGPVLPDQRPDVMPTIGWPITNAIIRILDEHLCEVPAGAIGEICIGGAGVARGYLNAAELTDQKFIPDPFSNIHGSRLYRTGDLGRLLPDGQITFIGRSDEQIKVRGFRVEPKEIVTLLDKHPDVQTSAVIVRADGAGSLRLLAYVVTKGPQPTASELRGLLRSRLPEFMIPAVFVRLQDLPLTSNGKLDRAALPEPTTENTLSEEKYVAPRSVLERRVTAMIGSVLGLERVSIDGNFFLLGGHSLLGTQVIARVRDEFGVDLPLRSIFDSPTPALLAEEIGRVIVATLNAMSAEDIERALQQTPISEGQR